jgi:ATP-dependent Clp protease ATP-binding subunit ClpA
MDKINYPLLYYQLKDDLILGILVGTTYQVVDSELRKVKSTLNDHLQKQYKKFDSYPYFDIENPRLKMIHVKMRPTYRDNTTSYPLGYEIEVPVPIIYGEIDQDYYECFLPLWGQSFYYYDARQFDSLVHHFVVNMLNQQTPEQLFKYMQYPIPKMDTVSLKVNYNRDFDWDDAPFKKDFPVLKRLAEKFPTPKTIKTSALPQAAWELEDKVAEVTDKLISTRSNVIIVGESGVGKSAVLMQVIKKVSQHFKKNQIENSFWRIMPQRITASSKYLGEWEETVENLVGELSMANGVLWVVDMIQLLEIGGSGPEDSVAAFLMSYLQQDKLQIIGEATPRELDSMRRLLPGFVETFQIVQVDELPETKTQAVLDKFAQYVDQKYKINIKGEAMSLTYRLLKRYYPYESFPGKGIKFLGQCLNETQLNQGLQIDKKIVVDNFVKQTGLPEMLLRDDLLLDTQELSDFFNHRIIGQKMAVDKLCETVKIFKAGLNNPFKPIATVLFAGPTGVGKTASAKALADYFFGKGQIQSPLVRIDMSEFQHPSQITRLVGSGREVGQLVKEIRDKPFSVLLLDEVEKADLSIFDALLTVLDEGILVDAYGRTTNFRNTIIIMTSNLGASNQKSIGYVQTTDPQAQYRSAIEKHFRPEFVNRIDHIIMFNPLSQEDIILIAQKELAELKKREGFLKRNLSIHFSKRVVEHLSVIGFDERYGARPLQRAVEQSLVNPIASWLLEHPDIQNRDIEIDYDGTLIIKS